VLGLTVLLMIGTFVGGSVIEFWVSAATSPVVGVVSDWMWTAIWTAFTATTTVVTYHELRVAKEGTDIDQITDVFD
jgi:hypothetical protein